MILLLHRQVLMWKDIKPYLRGIGTRVWFLHQTDGKHKKPSKASIAAVNKNHDNNLIVSYYEGTINEVVDFHS